MNSQRTGWLGPVVSRRAFGGAALGFALVLTVGLAIADAGSQRTGLLPKTGYLARLFTHERDVVTDRLGWRNNGATAAYDRRSELRDVNDVRVDRWVARFTSDLEQGFVRDLERMDRYDEMISAKLAERGMPQELIYLALIESGFDPRARSPARATGMWQFVGETARRYGLRVNSRVDERKDPAKATDAALSYLSDLYDKFGSWYLAAAAYNAGENRIARLMRHVNGRERGTDADYFRIWPRLPRETRDYVPKLVAAARVAQEPERYGLDVGIAGD